MGYKRKRRETEKMSHEDQAEKASKDERVQSRSETNREQNNYYVNHPPPLPPKNRGGGGEINYKFGISSYYITTMYKILIKQQNNKNNKVLLHNSGNCIQYLAITYNGKEYEKEYMYS